MLVQDIKKISDLNIGFKLLNVRESSVHMHDAYELIFILKGSVDLKCTIFNYSLTEGDIFIVNVKELHSFTNGSDDNVILVMHLDPYEYLSIFPSLDFYLFVCDSYSNRNKTRKELKNLQIMLINLWAMTMKSSVNAVSEIEEQTRHLITYLINNFQSFYLSDRGYRHVDADNIDPYQRDRLSEIQEYIYKNYRDKISLDDLAANLNLNKFYVSHLIKNIIGLSMTEFLSLNRIEQAEKLLLSNNMSVEQVALESGFSARRYFEKHFFRWFGVSPAVHKERSLKAKKQIYHEISPEDLSETQYKDIVSRYSVKATPVGTPNNQEISYTIDLTGQGKYFPHTWEDTIIISDGIKTIPMINPHLITDIKKNLKADTIRIYDIFDGKKDNVEMAVNRYQNFFDLAIHEGLKIEFAIQYSRVINDETLTGVIDFFKTCLSRYDPDIVATWSALFEYTGRPEKKNLLYKNRFTESMKNSNIDIKIRESRADLKKGIYSHNSGFLVPYIIHNSLKENVRNTLTYRELSDISVFINESSSPQDNRGIFSEFGERKPIYYAWKLLAMLGDQLLHMEDGLAITKKGSDIRILLYDSINANTKTTTEGKINKNAVSLEFENIDKDYTITQLYLNAEQSLFSHRASIQFEHQYSKEEIELMDSATSPTVTFSSLSQTDKNHNYRLDLNSYSAMLIILRGKS